MSLPRYSTYKDSQDPLVGQVPEHWPRSSLKYLADYQNGYAFKPEDWGDHGRPIIRIAQLTGDAEADRYAGIIDERVAVYDGDLLFSWSATLDSFFWRGEPAWLNQHIFKVTPTKEAATDFLYYLIKFWASKLGDVDAHGSTMRHIKKESLGQRLHIPPIDEQRAIAAFLDRETAKIDALVAEQEKLIALLKEKRQTVISHAVTKGLDPTVPMKDSGIEWLGEVPAHWEVMALARITVEKCDGPFGSGIKSDHYTEAGALVVRLQNIRSTGFFEGEPAYLDLEYFETELFRHNVVPGDVLIAGLGDEINLVGRACVAPEGISPALVKADCFRFRLDQESARPEFIATQLSAGASFDAGRLSSGSTRSRIPLSVMATRKVALPPLEEQVAVVGYLNKEIANFDALVFEAEQGIELLRERRSALISAAVTGKIDVRGQVAEQEAA